MGKLSEIVSLSMGHYEFAVSLVPFALTIPEVIERYRDAWKDAHQRKRLRANLELLKLARDIGLSEGRLVPVAQSIHEDFALLFVADEIKETVDVRVGPVTRKLYASVLGLSLFVGLMVYCEWLSRGVQGVPTIIVLAFYPILFAVVAAHRGRKLRRLSTLVATAEHDAATSVASRPAADPLS